MKNFETKLKGGHPNSLGNTIQVVREVLANESDFRELFDCYFSTDEIVRLRTSNAMKRICRERKEILIPYIDLFLTDISKIDQASTQWTLSQLFGMLKSNMTDSQILLATQIMQNNLLNSTDWIVLNQTMQTLGNWALNNLDLKQWMFPVLENIAEDPRKSVSTKAKKTINLLRHKD